MSDELDLTELSIESNRHVESFGVSWSKFDNVECAQLFLAEPDSVENQRRAMSPLEESQTAETKSKGKADDYPDYVELDDSEDEDEGVNSHAEPTNAVKSIDDVWVDRGSDQTKEETIRKADETAFTAVGDVHVFSSQNSSWDSSENDATPESQATEEDAAGEADGDRGITWDTFELGNWETSTVPTPDTTAEKPTFSENAAVAHDLGFNDSLNLPADNSLPPPDFEDALKRKRTHPWEGLHWKRPPGTSFLKSTPVQKGARKKALFNRPVVSSTATVSETYKSSSPAFDMKINQEAQNKDFDADPATPSPSSFTAATDVTTSFASTDTPFPGFESDDKSPVFSNKNGDPFDSPFAQASDDVPAPSDISDNDRETAALKTEPLPARANPTEERTQSNSGFPLSSLAQQAFETGPVETLRFNHLVNADHNVSEDNYANGWPDNHNFAGEGRTDFVEKSREGGTGDNLAVPSMENANTESPLHKNEDDFAAPSRATDIGSDVEPQNGGQDLQVNLDRNVATDISFDVSEEEKSWSTDPISIPSEKVVSLVQGASRLASYTAGLGIAVDSIVQNNYNDDFQKPVSEEPQSLQEPETPLATQTVGKSVFEDSRDSLFERVEWVEEDQDGVEENQEETQNEVEEVEDILEDEEDETFHGDGEGNPGFEGQNRASNAPSQQNDKLTSLPKFFAKGGTKKPRVPVDVTSMESFDDIDWDKEATPSIATVSLSDTIPPVNGHEKEAMQRDNLWSTESMDFPSMLQTKSPNESEVAPSVSADEKRNVSVVQNNRTEKLVTSSNSQVAQSNVSDVADEGGKAETSAREANVDQDGSDDDLHKKFEAVSSTRRLFSARSTFVEDVDAWPLFDLFMDVPHPASPSSSRQAEFVRPPTEGSQEDNSVEKELADSLPQILCLAFPEYDEANMTDHEYECNAADVIGFQSYSFTLKLESGVRVYGHVRRYLPPHHFSQHRIDVGRRSERAMLIFTRANGADEFFSAVLRTIAAVGWNKSALPQTLYSQENPEQSFLHQLYHKHRWHCCHYASNPQQRLGTPHILTVQGLEFGECEHFVEEDVNHFLIPLSLLHRPDGIELITSPSTSIIPLLRCIGVNHALRVFSALLCERRVLLVSSYTSRLAHCTRAALSMLSQGLLNWQHLCMPVLPPDLWQLVCAPVPYLLGILSPLLPRLDVTDGVGEIFIVNLDENVVSTRNMSDKVLSQRIPDLCMTLQRRSLSHNTSSTSGILIESSTNDILMQDLIEVLASDRRALHGQSIVAKHIAKKASKVVKSTFAKIQEKGLQYLSPHGGDKAGGHQMDNMKPDDPRELKAIDASLVYAEGCRNETAEEEVRVALVGFFLRLLGSEKGYLPGNESSNSRVDRQAFLRQRRTLGDGPGSPMWALLLNFSQTNLLENFARTHDREILKNPAVPLDAQLFWQCLYYHRKHIIPLDALSVRRVVRQMVQRYPTRQMQPTVARRLAMALTSKRKFQGNYAVAIEDLVELCRECSFTLSDVMSVIWFRLRDSKGLQWMHGYQSLQILKNLITHGPLAAITEATDGIAKIRSMRSYYKGRQTRVCVQMRATAKEVFYLLVQRHRLFFFRRICANQRRVAGIVDSSKFSRFKKLDLTAPFKNLHKAMKPTDTSHSEGTNRRGSMTSVRRASMSSVRRTSITSFIPARGKVVQDPLNASGIISAYLPASISRTGTSATFVQRKLAEKRGVLEPLVVDLNELKELVLRNVKKKQAEEDRPFEMRANLMRKQFLLLKFAIYLSPVFYMFDSHELFLSIVMFFWLSQQFSSLRLSFERSQQARSNDEGSTSPVETN